MALKQSTISSLQDLGPRIIILGPSNSGKSTLADAIARSGHSKVVHLDQLAFLPGSDWVARPAEEFKALHDEAIKEDSWVMDGPYAACLPQRLERATGLIILEISVVKSLYRYFRRTWFEPERVGALNSKKDSIKWDMLHWVATSNARTTKKWRELYAQSELPRVLISSQQDLDTFYSVMKLQLRP